jgi:hypothetical protein
MKNIISISHQGAPLLHTDSITEKTCGDIALLTIDMISKWCEVSGYSNSDDCPVILIDSSERSVHLKGVIDESESTDIKLTKYKGWHIFVADINRYTLRVCLVKRN